jgi:hypothetical protein
VPAVTARWLDHLLGEGASSRLESTNDGGVLDVFAGVAWERVGRLAVLRARLTETGHRLDGLCALEAVGGVVEGFGRRSYPDLVAGLLARALPVLRHLDMEWFDGLDPRIAVEVRRLLDLASRTDPAADLGSLHAELRLRDEEDWFGSPETGLLVLETIGGDWFLRPDAPRPTLTRPVVHIDHTALGYVAQAEAETVAETLRISIETGERTAMLSDEVCLRVGHEGQLVAAARSMRADEEGRLVAELALPIEMIGEPLVVVVGVGLELRAWTDEEFTARMAEHYGRRAEDALRAGQDGLAADLQAERLRLGGADEALEISGPSMADLVHEEPATISLLMRLWQQAGDEESLQAVRSLAAGAGELALAGRAEAQRLVDSEAELSATELRTLAAALLDIGDETAAAPLLAELDRLDRLEDDLDMDD